MSKGANAEPSLVHGRVAVVAMAFPWRAWAQLVRLPNVFTALADIALGALAVRGIGSPSSWWFSFLCLMAASACLYSAGMVWNDLFDWEQDRRERPFRPLPSGRVSRTAARRFGIGLLTLGMVFAAVGGWQDGLWTRVPLCLAAALVIVILLYDRWLKRCWAGPLGMGACRLLNVLLGFSVAGGTIEDGLLPAAVVGLYIVGVTWFARTEAQLSSRPQLMAAAVIMLCALALSLLVPASRPQGTSSALFPFLLVALGFFVGVPACRAVALPVPTRVQVTVRRAIFGLVLLDAVLASALIGNLGLIILVFLVPALYLGRWIYST